MEEVENMVLPFKFTKRCFFDGALRQIGDEIVLESALGDSFPWLVPAEVDNVIEKMQGETYSHSNFTQTKENKTKGKGFQDKEASTSKRKGVQKK